MKKTAAFFLFLLNSQLFGQPLTEVHTRWSDSFAEWRLFTTPEPTTDDPDPQPEEICSLKTRWPDLDRWNEWDLDCDGGRATIRQKWNDDPEFWELRMSGELVTIKTRWRGDLSEWKISDDHNQIYLKTRYNSPEEWLAQDRDLGRFYMYTLYRGDLRDWAIDDQLADDISPAMRLAAVFTVLYNSAPNR